MKASSHPQGPRSRFFGADLYAASRRDPLGFMERLAREHGDIVHFRIGTERIVLLNHPDYVRDTLLTHAKNFAKGRGIARTKNMLGESILVRDGEKHRCQRRVEQPAFHHERIASYSTMMVAAAEAVNARWQDGQSLDALLEMRGLTLTILNKTMFSQHDEEKVAELRQALDETQNLLPFRSFFLPLERRLVRLPLPVARRWSTARAYLEAEMQCRIEERRCNPESYNDLLAMLCEAEQERVAADPHAATNGDDTQLRNEALTIFMAGTETLSMTLMFTWLLLARYPSVEAALHEELDRVLGDREPTFADLPHLQYTEMVFLETMRLYPVTWRIVRRVVTPYELDGHSITDGSLVIVSPYLSHRDARYYPDPKRFDPSRWMPEQRASRPSHCFFPFGSGPRVCIGDRFAMTAGVLSLASIARNWRLRVPADFKLELRPRLTLTVTRGVPIMLERRHKEKAGIACEITCAAPLLDVQETFISRGRARSSAARAQGGDSV